MYVADERIHFRQKFALDTLTAIDQITPILLSESGEQFLMTMLLFHQISTKTAADIERRERGQ